MFVDLVLSLLKLSSIDCSDTQDLDLLIHYWLWKGNIYSAFPFLSVSSSTATTGNCPFLVSGTVHREKAG